MAYRNGTYLAFHAGGVKDPTASDIRYYNLMKAWRVCDDNDIEFVNSHEKTAAVRDSSKRQTLRRSLATRLKNSKHMILVVTEQTRLDTDWVPWEIEYAIDECRIPVLCAYPGRNGFTDVGHLQSMWPRVLADRINKGWTKTLHFPFLQLPMTDAIRQWSVHYPPSHAITVYDAHTYKRWGIPVN